MSYRPKILIVDDNASLCKSLKVFLSVLDAEILTALNGREAKILLAENDFDLVLLDLILPDRSFSKILDRVDSRNVDTVVILMSGHSLRDVAAPLLEKRVYGFLQKPFELDELLSTVQGALSRRMQYRRRATEEREGFRTRLPVRDRRRLWKDRRLLKDPCYPGPERRSGKDRRSGREPGHPWDTGPLAEKRQHRRVNVKWPLTIRVPWGTMRGEIRNVSAGGAFLCAGNFLKLHEMISFKLGDIVVPEHALSVLARVVRSNVYCLDDITHAYGIAVEFVDISDDDRRALTDYTSQCTTGSDIISNKPLLEKSSRGGKTMVEEKKSVELMINPGLYPAVKIVLNEPVSEHEVLEATAPLRKEVWLHVAKECKERAAAMDVFASQKLVSALNSLADMIFDQVNAEEKRERNREAYESFADFVTEINSRTDLDKIRRAQLIHDKASELQLN
jgi:CheY-like chemotaxis protein